MRARYSAYALRDPRFIMNTTASDSPHARPGRGAWRSEIESWCDAVELVGLEVVSASSQGDEGFVHFRATIKTDERIDIMEERSRFRKHHGRWVYLDGSG